MNKRPVFSLPWLTMWATTLALGWVLPNHYLPWSSFHGEAWVSFWLLMAGAVVSLRTGENLPVSLLGCVAAVCALTPWVQFATGMLPFVGPVWMHSAVLAGFGLATVLAAQWQRASPGQAADGLFFAIGLAALFSVGLQLEQWTQLDLFGYWSMGGNGQRPYANLGQPNLLSTFLIWGLLAVLWGVERRQIGPGIAILTASYFLFGIALTQSRTGWLALGLLYFALWRWRHLWRFPRAVFVATILAICFIWCVAGLDLFSAALGNSLPPDMEARLAFTGDSRWNAWKLFLQASFDRPWFGYGWGGVHQAQLAQALNAPELHQVFGQAHNLILDLVLALGWPAGLAAFAVLTNWVVRCLRATRSSVDAVMILVVLVVGLHAMLELPLHYAYVLLPVGLIVGVLNVQHGFAVTFEMSPWSVRAIVLAMSLFLAALAREYFQIESSYTKLRLEWAHIDRSPPQAPPSVYILTQFSELMRFGRTTPVEGTDRTTIEWMTNVVITFPSSGNILNLAKALALNGDPEAASIWLRKMCTLVTFQECQKNRTYWDTAAKTQPKLAMVRWEGQ